MTESMYRSIANPRRITLGSQTVDAALTPRPDASALEIVGDDAPACVDGMCETHSQHAR